MTDNIQEKTITCPICKSSLIINKPNGIILCPSCKHALSLSKKTRYKWAVQAEEESFEYAYTEAIEEPVENASAQSNIFVQSKPQGEVLLSVKDLHKSFGKLDVLQGVTIDINKGDVVAIIGPSGCGKSTFLRCLNLLEIPSSGEIIFGENEVFAKGKPTKNINLHRQKVGMVFQQFNLFPHMTVLNNMTIAPIKVLGISKEEAEDMKAKLAEVGATVEFK